MKRKLFITFGLAGAALTALCCFTPVLAGLLGLLGLGAVMGYLDYGLLPALTGFLCVALYGLLRRNREDRLSCCTGHSAKEHSKMRRS